MNTFIDVYELMAEDEPSEKTFGENTKNTDEMLIESLNTFGEVNISFIARGAGISVEKAIFELRGTIFQDPDGCENGLGYDITKGWLISAQYLGGNIRKKLDAAYEKNEKYKGVFESNIKALKAILPEATGIDGIYINPGASWISDTKEYSSFLREFLELRFSPQVIYNKELSRFKIIPPPMAGSSILNTDTYGVKEKKYTEFGYEYNKQYFTGLELFEHLLNAKTAKVFDYFPKGGGSDYEPVFNKEKTVEAQEKQRELIEGFRKWVYSNRKRIAKFEDYYYTQLGGYTYTRYDGSFLKLPDLNPEVKLYRHQRNAIAHVLLKKKNLKTLLAHRVGTGKTYEMIVSAYELKRMNLSKKTIYVVPDVNVLTATVDMHRYLYKNDNILAVYPKDFALSRRNECLEKIRDGDYTVIYMAHSTFDMIVMSKEYYVNKKSKAIIKLKTAMFNSSNKHERSMLEKQSEALSKDLKKYQNEAVDCPWLTYDKLNVDTLIVDEAHNYKNIGVYSHSDNIVGINRSGSKKSREMLEKVHFTKRVIFATGTPMTNSISDLFTMQTYLQPETLEYHNVSSFDSWMNTFAVRETQIECDIDSNSRNLRPMTRYSSFHNLGELMALFTQVCDFYMPSEEKDSELPKFNGYTDVCIPQSAGGKAYIDELSERMEKIRAKEVSRTEDNPLKITTCGNLSGLDLRLVGRYDLFDPKVKNKIDYCAENVFKMHIKYPESAQVVFSDIGTPKESFNIYDCLADKLVELGMKRGDIAYVHDAVSEAARRKLFADLNKGKIKVVIGSTQKLGVGVNMQERLVALHHLSVPWKPADMVQREGRILRKGNTSEEVFIYRYITKWSFDAYLWQLLENKQRFIASFLGGICVGNDADDIADSVLSYAEVKALAIGDPLIKKRVETANILEKERIYSAARQNDMRKLRAFIESAPAEGKEYMTAGKRAEEDYAAYLKIKETLRNEERVVFGEKLLRAVCDNVGSLRETVFPDKYRGFEIMLPANMTADGSCVFVLGKTGGKYYCSMSLDKTPLGCCKTIDCLLESLNKTAEKFYARAEDVLAQRTVARKDLDRDNPHLREIERLTKELKEIDRLLEENAKNTQKAC